MYVIERRQMLLEAARTTGRVDVAATSRELGLAPETIRRDLKDLERQGLLRRVYGGAVAVERLSFESGLAVRSTRHQAQKNRIAAAAVTFVKSAESVFIDEGFLPSLVGEHLPADRPLTVVTSSLATAKALVDRPEISRQMLTHQRRQSIDKHRLRRLHKRHRSLQSILRLMPHDTAKPAQLNRSTATAPPINPTQQPLALKILQIPQIRRQTTPSTSATRQNIVPAMLTSAAAAVHVHGPRYCGSLAVQFPVRYLDVRVLDSPAVATLVEYLRSKCCSAVRVQRRRVAPVEVPGFRAALRTHASPDRTQKLR